MFKSNALEKLRKIVEEDRLLTSKDDLLLFGSDETRIVHLPDCVVFPETTGEVSSILKLANLEKIPVVPRGGGSGLSGGALPVKGGILLVLTRMDRILEVDKENMTATVEPGVILLDLKKAVEKLGLFYPPDPNSLDISTLGGNIAENAGGPQTVKYGVTRDFCLGLEVVLPTGEVINTGVKTRKGVAGYDLTRLIIGSEGTLGVVTKATLRLIPKPQATKTMIALFAHFNQASCAISKIMSSKAAPSVLEFLDSKAVKLVREYLARGLSFECNYLLIEAGEDAAFLLIEVDGEKEDVEKRVEEIIEILNENKAEFKVAETETQREKIWIVRRSVKNSILSIYKDDVSEDIVVPVSKIPEAIRRFREVEAELSVKILNYGHFGDGNIHTHVLASDPAKVHKAIEKIFEISLSLGGSITGEHGVGITKACYLPWEIGEEQMKLLRRIKKAFDPNNILNPGKMGL
ncbi:FAD-binding protein [bacterium]|nr:FAD-binding protein [bacterium]